MPWPRHQIHDGPRKAAIDDDLVAIDVGRAVARQEQRDAGDVVRRSDPPQRHHGRATLDHAGGLVEASLIGVMTMPGLTTLLRIPCGPHSLANCRESMMTPALLTL